MDINKVLAGLPDDDDDSVPQGPTASGSVRLDTAFESADYGIESETSFTKLSHEPLRKVARVKACKTRDELDALDKLMMEFAQ